MLVLLIFGIVIVAIVLIAIAGRIFIGWKFTLRHWAAAGLSALAWGAGGFLGVTAVSEKWNEFNNYFTDANVPADLINSTTLSGYYSLALGGIIAALLGSAVLYLLLRSTPSK